MADVLDRIVEQNLGVYRAAASRLQEDVSQEAQVTSDYRGRLVYELLQNADDAMAAEGEAHDRVAFFIDDEEMWIANSGRPLTDDDVQGLCGLGASSKIDSQGVRRASIGHKGLGFKSVLEITESPSVYSRTYSFQLGAAHARPHIDRLWSEGGMNPPKSVPAMRFPSRLSEEEATWQAFSGNGFNTAFRFPFLRDLSDDQRTSLAELLLDLPLTTVLFLKHLERVEVSVRQNGESLHRAWLIRRERRESSGWVGCRGLSSTGLYRVAIESDDGESATFLIAHDADVEIGDHRSGLSGPAWEGVELSEVSVAALVPEHPEPMPPSWRHFHVFLPTAEPCPYPLLVNAAFVTDLSRQQVRTAPEPRDYNSHLIRRAAFLVRGHLLPVLREQGLEHFLAVLDRGDPNQEAVPSGVAADLFHEALCHELADIPLLPTEAGEELVFPEAVLPPAILLEAGRGYREVLVPDPVWEDRRFPASQFCIGRWARVAADHGAAELSPEEGVGALARLLAPARSMLQADASGGFELDPILELCTALWERANPDDRRVIEVRARSESLFPIRQNEDGTVERVALGEETAFYPPRSARHELPLEGLQFMCHSICWGALLPKERAALLETRMKAWTALFEIKEFRFEEVVRAAVSPGLVLNPDDDARALLETLQNLGALASVCQLAGSYAKPDRPLRYQRLQSERALFNLSRLPVPCKTSSNDEVWLPAYKVYFGTDWIGTESIEQVIDAIPAGDPTTESLDLPFLAPPSRFLGTLGEFGDPESEIEAQGDDEVGIDEDTDQALESDERARWVAFLSWIGVNRCLRPVHFHDVEDDATGWLTTKDLTQPKGWAFKDLGATWEGFREQLTARIARRPDAAEVAPYLYDVHDLEGIASLLAAAEREAGATLGRRLFEHLGHHWSWYAGFADAQIALVPSGKFPSARNRPQRAMPDELVNLGDNLWLYRLRRSGFCPTTHGPRRPDRTWLPSDEVDRRFGRRGQTPGQLLPLLDVESELPDGTIRALSERLGVRGDLSPSTFGVDDAALLCERLRLVVESQGVESVDSSALRTLIKPVYRQLFELLSGRSADAAGDGVLKDAPLLADTADGFRFLPAQEMLYSRTPGTRERSGVAGIVPTFVLEADPGATAPLSRLFGVRILEEALDWDPDPGECPLDSEEVAKFRQGLSDLVAPLLARIRVERSEPRDKSILSRFARIAEPVESLRLACMLDGVPLEGLEERPYFVQPPSRGKDLQVFVVWEGEAWPPSASDAQGLAMALADALGVNLVETFLAFIQSDEARRRGLLDIAGATGLIREVEDDLADVADETDERDLGVGPTPAPEASDEVDGTSTQTPSSTPPAAPPIPLFRFEQITLDGEPMLVAGEAPDGQSGRGGHSGSDSSSTHGSGRAAAGTDLAALDQLGMMITMGYELRRLARAGHPDARKLGLSPSPHDAKSIVVDVHSPAVIREAEEASAVVMRIMLELEESGISRNYPGFDILTIADGEVDRMIELKSSGVNARAATMSWNEWKSAQSNKMRSSFWLYLVGNLRSDLDHAPFVRAIQDPFGSLIAEEREEHSIRRGVQLQVREFEIAEHLELGVNPFVAR